MRGSNPRLVIKPEKIKNGIEVIKALLITHFNHHKD
uniref:Uncharacterized protein n=1 Tax=Siphoviridae sp. ctC6Q17 TaxID=2827271 RepID=A0A8S5R3Q7_9CAUD|nr:MAG TPA: hypothetical protein [Siphoviridae sp. ctC6Q17]